MDLADRMKKEFLDIFKSCLERGDRIVGEPAKLEVLTEEEVARAGLKPEPALTAITINKQWYQRAFKLLQEELSAGLIEKVDSNTMFCSKSFFIPKADNVRLRRVTDFRNVNRFLKMASHPLYPI